MKTAIKYVLTVSVFTMLTACGGGGAVSGVGSSDAGATPSVELNKPYSIASNSVAISFKDNSFELSFEEKIKEIYFVDSFDIDKDGVDDVVISASIEGCCDVTAEQIKKLKGITPKIYLSNFGKPTVVSFPESAKTTRTWAGKFFEKNGVLYYIHGRNGELGLPDQNLGEKSQIYRISYSSNDIYLNLVAEMPTPKTTASVDVKVYNDYVEILQNNYGNFSSENNSIYTSQIYRFNAKEELVAVNGLYKLREKIAHNHIAYSDFIPGGLLASSEVNKSSDEKNILLSPTNASYVAKDNDFIELIPALFGNDKSGATIGELKAGGNVIVIDVASVFVGHLASFKGSGIAAYQVDLNAKTAATCKDVCDELSISLAKANGSFLRKIDLDFDGVKELYLSSYAQGSVNVFHVSGGRVRQTNSKEFYLQDVNTWIGQVSLLRNNNSKCIYSLSSIQNFAATTKKTIAISPCIKKPIN